MKNAMVQVIDGDFPVWNWSGDQRVEVDGCNFQFESTDPGDAFVVLKESSLVRSYERLLHEERPQRIVELGMKSGGSTALMAVAARPLVLVGIDLEPVTPPALVDLIERRALHGSIHLHPGLDQADRPSLLAAVAGSLGGAAIDLVIDDASHVLGPTAASFDALFPLVRPGGMFIVEDWAADVYIASKAAGLLADDADRHERTKLICALIQLTNDPEMVVPPAVVTALGEAHARRGPDWSRGITGIVDALVNAAATLDLDILRLVPIRTERPLSDLLVRLSMATSIAPSVISSVEVDQYWVAVRRGPAALDPDGFRLQDVGIDPFGYLE